MRVVQAGMASIIFSIEQFLVLSEICPPQHDILWDTLTARQHMIFYGRLKNVNGAALNEAVVNGLKQASNVQLASIYHCSFAHLAASSFVRT